MRLVIDVDPDFKKIADYYWESDICAETPHVTIWDWLKRDYGVIRIGQRGDKQEMLIQFPDEAHKTLFLLRWG